MNPNLSILPFYDSVEKQSHRKEYGFGKIFSLFTPYRKILPFQIIREHSGSSAISSAHLVNEFGQNFADVKQDLLDTGIGVVKFSNLGYDVIFYPGKLLLSTDTPEGRYYLKLKSAGITYYSEIFTVVRKVEEYLRIDYRDSENLVFENGQVYFGSGFTFSLYLPTQIGRPEYVFEEQVTKRDGYSFYEKQISEKVYRFNFVAPEYLLDAIRIIRMVDEVKIINNGDEYIAQEFLVTPTWQDQGFLAGVEAEFRTNAIVKKLGKGYVPLSGPDFNDSFNDDFDSED